MTEGGDMTEGEMTEGDTETRLSWHAGGTGGTYFPLSNEFKTVVEDNTDFTLNVQSTGASVENVGSLASGDADFALIQNDIASFAKNGTASMRPDNAVENLQGVATRTRKRSRSSPSRTRASRNSPTSKGRRSTLATSGAGPRSTRTVLESVGISEYTEQNASFSQAAGQLRNGDIDAAFVVGGWPVGAIEDLANTSDLVIVTDLRRQPCRSEEDASWFADDTIPADTSPASTRLSNDRCAGDDCDERRTARRDGRVGHRGHRRQRRRPLYQDGLHQRGLRSGRDVHRTPPRRSGLLRRVTPLTDAVRTKHRPCILTPTGMRRRYVAIACSVPSSSSGCRSDHRRSHGRRSRRAGEQYLVHGADGTTVALEYCTVSAYAVYDEYTVRGDHLEMTRMEFESFGWGLPSGANVTREDGMYVFDPPGNYTRVTVSPGDVAGHKLHVGAETYDLVARTNGRSVHLYVTQRSSFGAATDQFNAGLQSHDDDDGEAETSANQARQSSQTTQLLIYAAGGLLVVALIVVSFSVFQSGSRRKASSSRSRFPASVMSCSRHCNCSRSTLSTSLLASF